MTHPPLSSPALSPSSTQTADAPEVKEQCNQSARVRCARAAHDFSGLGIKIVTDCQQLSAAGKSVVEGKCELEAIMELGVESTRPPREFGEVQRRMP